MPDLALLWNQPLQIADIAMAGPSLLLGDDLETAILVSLFTEGSADPDDILTDAARIDPRGYWTDALDGDRIGSKLWQVFIRPSTEGPNGTVNFVRTCVARALQWLLDDGVAKSLDISVQFVAKGSIAFQVVVHKPDGTAPSKFQYAWNQET